MENAAAAFRLIKARHRGDLASIAMKFYGVPDLWRVDAGRLAETPSNSKIVVSSPPTRFTDGLRLPTSYDTRARHRDDDRSGGSSLAVINIGRVIG